VFTDKALRKQVSLEICGVYSPFAIIFYNFYSFSNSYGIYCSPFSIFRIAGHFLVSTRVKKLTKYVGNFENSQIVGERNILNPKINSHTKTNLKIN